MIQLALYDNKDVWDLGARFIKWKTKSPYSHCELVIGDYCYSSSIPEGGVRKKVRTEVIDKHPERWTLIDLPWANEKNCLENFSKIEGLPYGWSDLIKRQFFNLTGDDRGMFCSECVGFILSFPRPNKYSPDEIEQWGIYLNNFNI